MRRDNYNSDTGAIYVLMDPETLAVRYVGRSWDPFKRKHFGSSPVGQWAQTLRARGLKPIVAIVEQYTDRFYRCELERKWVEFFQARGCDLLNERLLIKSEAA